jgi:hypothetical protein
VIKSLLVDFDNLRNVVGYASVADEITGKALSMFTDECCL